MLPLGMILVFAGYGVGSWGWVLVKGYNITLRQWFSPLTPFDWQGFSLTDTVPKGQIFPGAGSGKQASGSGKQQPPGSPGVPPGAGNPRGGGGGPKG